MTGGVVKSVFGIDAIGRQDVREGSRAQIVSVGTTDILPWQRRESQTGGPGGL